MEKVPKPDGMSLSLDYRLSMPQGIAWQPNFEIGDIMGGASEMLILVSL